MAATRSGSHSSRALTSGSGSLYSLITPRRGSLRRHRLRRQRGAGGEQGLAAAGGGGAELDLLEGEQGGEAGVGEGAVDEARDARPAGAVGLDSDMGAVAEEGRDRDVGEADLVAEQPALARQLALQIVELAGEVLAQSLLDPRRVAGFAPDDGVDELRVEQAPDEDVAEAGVGIFLEPAGAGAVRPAPSGSSDRPG